MVSQWLSSGVGTRMKPSLEAVGTITKSLYPQEVANRLLALILLP